MTLVLIVLVSAPAVASVKLRVTPSVEVRQEFDSNIGWRDHDTESDVVTAVTPAVQFSYEDDRGFARARLGIRSRSYWDHAELNGIDSFARGEFERLLTPRLTLITNGSFDFFPDRDVAFDDGGQQLAGGRPDYKRASAQVGFRYALGPVSTLTLASGWEGENFDEGDGQVSFARRDWGSLYGYARYSRQLSERDEMGLTVRVSGDRFDELAGANAGLAEETNQMVSALVHWQRAWSPVWSTLATIGPRWVRIEQDEIPGLVVAPGSGLDFSPSETSLGIVGTLEITRLSKRTATTLSYRRDTRPSSGYGSNTDTDTLSGDFTLRLTQRLELNLGAFAMRYQSVGDALAVVGSPFFGLPCELLGLSGFTPGRINLAPVCVGLVDQLIDATVTGGHVRLGWRVTQDWSTFMRYTYRDQTSRGDRPITEYTDHRVMMGFRYAVPIDLF